MTRTYSDSQAAAALTGVLGNSPWIAVQLAHGYLALLSGESIDDAARIAYRYRVLPLRRCKELLQRAQSNSFLSSLAPRPDTGSSVNPVTKLFPGRVTEQRFLEELDGLPAARPGIDYVDDREGGHTLSDFTVSEGDHELPINIKNAGTRFERAEQLVGLAPDDCIPIPAYKAHGALEVMPNLLYVIAVDYKLVEKLDHLLPQLFSPDEAIVWDLITRFKGTQFRKAEDAFILRTVAAHWDRIKTQIAETPFHVVSARRAIKVLHDKPKRTPGIGLRAWGNRASAEINVHLSIQEDTTAWSEVAARIARNGVSDVVAAVNRRHKAWVYDPEI